MWSISWLVFLLPPKKQYWLVPWGQLSSVLVLPSPFPDGGCWFSPFWGENQVTCSMLDPIAFQREKKMWRWWDHWDLGYQDLTAIDALIRMLCNLEKFKETKSGGNPNTAGYFNFLAALLFPGANVESALCQDLSWSCMKAAGEWMWQNALMSPSDTQLTS